MSVYTSIMRGLDEAVQYQEGKIPVRRTKIAVKPVELFSSEDIKQIRKDLSLTQVLFASTLGVSKKTVEAWECGRNSPEGPSRRLLQLLRDDPDLIDQLMLKA